MKRTAMSGVGFTLVELTQRIKHFFAQQYRRSRSIPLPFPDFPQFRAGHNRELRVAAAASKKLRTAQDADHRRLRARQDPMERPVSGQAQGHGPAGKVDHGFDAASAQDLQARLKPLIWKTRPYAKIAHRGVWVDPELLAEIKYRAISADGKVRHPFFKGIREGL